MSYDPVAMAARLAAIYGEDWNALSQEARRVYLDFVELVHSIAKGAQP